MKRADPETKILSFRTLYCAVRSLLGPADVCIYPISCSEYARICWQTKPMYLSIPLIVVRVLSCNPITAIVRFFYFRATFFQRHNH